MPKEIVLVSQYNTIKSNTRIKQNNVLVPMLSYLSPPSTVNDQEGKKEKTRNREECAMWLASSVDKTFSQRKFPSQTKKTDVRPGSAPSKTRSLMPLVLF